jgi:hypothetical protein
VQIGKERKNKVEDTKRSAQSFADLETHHFSATGDGGRVVGQPRGLPPRILSLHVGGGAHERDGKERGCRAGRESILM